MKKTGISVTKVLYDRNTSQFGGMAERLIAPDLKSGGLRDGLRGFKSLSLFQIEHMKNGALGEIAVMKHFAALGYEVYHPITENATCDLIVAKAGMLYRVEVKSTTRKCATGHTVELRRVRANKTKNTIHLFDTTRSDFLAVYVVHEDRVVVLESAKIKARGSITV